MERYHVSRQMTSGHIAKLRLEQALASDFLECSTEKLISMQQEILQILSRYMNIDETEKIQLKFTQKIQQGEPYVKTIQIKGL